jgi:hypothetical protein
VGPSKGNFTRSLCEKATLGNAAAIAIAINECLNILSLLMDKHNIV